jgi:cobyrinic acid a,c-diamide synthase
LDISEKAEPFDYMPDFLPIEKSDCNIKLYIAYDEAFSFWYEDNHDLFKALGAGINFFSPLHCKSLPEDADGLVLWGGYPEVFAKALEENTYIKASLKSAIQAGLPVYAEGGGFMYLQQTLMDMQGNNYKMLGVLPGKVKMTNRLQNFGYSEIEALKDNLLCKAGEKINAHFFHHSVSDSEGNCFKAVKRSGASFSCVVAEANIFAGYQHLHFWGNSVFAENFINACFKYRKGEK